MTAIVGSAVNMPANEYSISFELPIATRKKWRLLYDRIRSGDTLLIPHYLECSLVVILVKCGDELL
jgi:hypothetical protein